MSLFCKVEAETKVLKVAADKIYEFFKFRPYYLSSFPCTNIHSAELLLGEWGTEGCVVQWNYSYDGKAIADKEMVEAIDDKNRSITWKMIEGHLLEFYKSFKAVIQVTPAGDEGCVVGFIMEYEKAHHEIMDPNAKLQFSVELCNEIEAHLIQERDEINTRHATSAI